MAKYSDDGKILIKGPENISTYTIKEGTEVIGEGAFANNQQLKFVFLPVSLIEIRGNAFKGCSNLIDIILPENVKTIGERAFYSCHKIKEIYLPSSIENLGEEAFSECSCLGRIKISEGIKTLPKGIFRACGGLLHIKSLPYHELKITFPESLLSIECEAFASCKFLKEIILPKHISTIGERAFEGCNDLVKVQMPNTSLKIKQSAFRQCTKLKTVECYGAKDEGQFQLDSKEGYIGDEAFIHCTELDNIVLPCNITKIGNSAFENTPSLEKINLPANVELIGSGAFIASGIKTISFPGIKEISELAFSWTPLKEINFPQTLKRIEKEAFLDCTDLKKVMLPKDADIAEDAFKGCSEMEIIKY
ncbi:MAG: leucine-rich repeat domain-containing protein [Muribaculaceae bacterium]|nr:leucine-rich repeat domain-containing protein [Muribaculaceae bacterium]